QFIRPGRQPRLVIPRHVERLAVGRRPERPIVHRQHPHIVGIPLQHDRLIRGQRRPPRRVVDAHPRRDNCPRGRILDRQVHPPPPGPGPHPRPAPGHRDAPHHNPRPPPTRDPPPRLPLPRQPRPIQRHRHRLQRTPRRRRRLNRVGHANPRPPVAIPPHYERR